MLTQYSPRLGDAISADTDVTNTMAAGNDGSARRCSTWPRAIAWVRKYGPCRLVRSSSSKLSSLRVEQIRAHARRAARVVDERVDGPQRRSRVGGDADALVALREIAAHVVDGGAERAQLVERRAHVRFGAHAAERQRPALFRERAGDAEADAARAAGDERSAFAHASGPKNVRYGSPSASRLT